MTAFHCDKTECEFSKQCIQMMAAKEDAIPPCANKDSIPEHADNLEATKKLSKPEPD